MIPFLLMLFFFVWSAWMFFELHRPPADALEIDVVAKQWMWKFQHPGRAGARSTSCTCRSVEPVKLTMASQDVIHSLYMPALRLKQDVLPGRYTTHVVQRRQAGHLPLACAEFCGTDHCGDGRRLHRA